jgi:hypothetical protein
MVPDTVGGFLVRQLGNEVDSIVAHLSAGGE